MKQFAAVINIYLHVKAGYSDSSWLQGVKLS